MKTLNIKYLYYNVFNYLLCKAQIGNQKPVSSVVKHSLQKMGKHSLAVQNAVTKGNEFTIRNIKNKIQTNLRNGTESQQKEIVSELIGMPERDTRGTDRKSKLGMLQTACCDSLVSIRKGSVWIVEKLQTCRHTILPTLLTTLFWYVKNVI